MYVAKIVCQTTLPSFLTWASLAMFCLEKYQTEILCSAQHHCHWMVGEITQWCMKFE